MGQPCDKKTLQKVLRLISASEYGLAVKTWSDHRHRHADTCDDCPYAKMTGHEDCCLCLESNLRTMNLYEHGDGGALLNAARKIEIFHLNQMHPQHEHPH